MCAASTSICVNGTPVTLQALKLSRAPPFNQDTPFADIIALIHASFPDGRFDYTDIYDGEVPNTVVVEGFRFTGTHTGKPYSFLPRVPALPASGKHVANDEERLYFTMSVDHKIEHVTVIAMGMHTGPAGIYEQLDGSLPNEEECSTAAC
jgi:hypothetical protein